MKSVKKIGFKVLLVALALNIGACSDSFLDLDNPQSLPTGGTIKDLTSLVNASNGVYNQLQAGNYYNRTFILLPELIGDNVFISGQNVGFYLNYDNLAVSPEDGYAQGAWSSMYNTIVNANLVIAGGEALALPTAQQATANQVIGEMYAARALAHFDLVRLFAQPYNFSSGASHPGIPVITAPQTVIIAPERNTVQEVYTQIVADLQKAITLLNVPRKDGYMTPGAAKALLSKVYLYMEDWENAERYASAVIDGEPSYSLLSTSQYVSSWSQDFTSESLFEVVNTADDRAGVNGIGAFYEQGAYGDALATEDLYNTYSSTDVRRELIEVGSRGTAENPAYIAHKYPRGVTSQDDNIKVIRLSEVYLIRAEALAEQSGKDAQAQADLNRIVQRADPAAEAIMLTGQALVDRIIEERRKELAFEGNRLFDLNRKKMDVNHIESERSTIVPAHDPRLILPIPQGEINANPNI